MPQRKQTSPVSAIGGLLQLIGGVLVILVLLGSFAVSAWQARNRLPKGHCRALAGGFLAGLATFVIHGAVDASFFVIELAFWFMFALAWVGGLRGTFRDN